MAGVPTERPAVDVVYDALMEAAARGRCGVRGHSWANGFRADCEECHSVAQAFNLAYRAWAAAEPPSDEVEKDIDRFRRVAIDKKALCRKLNVSRRWVEYRMRDEGLPFHKDPHSRTVRFVLGEVEGWLVQRAPAGEDLDAFRARFYGLPESSS